MRDHYYSKAIDQLTRLAEGYSIRLSLEYTQDPEAEHAPQPDDFVWGPQGDSGVSFAQRLVYAYEPEPEVLLHEIAHCVLGVPSTKICEAYLLLPFESELAKYVAKGLPRSRRSYFLKCVKDYQLITTIGYEELELRHYGKFYRNTLWWRKGIRRAQRLGLLDERREPTFERPRWIGSGVCPGLTYWDPQDDDHYA